MGQYKKNEMEEVKASIEFLSNEIQTVKRGINVILNIFNQMNGSSPVTNSIQTLQNPEFLKEVEKATMEMLKKVVPQMGDAGIGVATLQASPQPSTYSFHDCVFNAPVVCGSGDEHNWESEETIENDDDTDYDEDDECECTGDNDHDDASEKAEAIRAIHALVDDLHYGKVAHFEEMMKILHIIVLNPDRYYEVRTSDERYAAVQSQEKIYIRRIFHRLPPLEHWTASDCMDQQNLARLAIDLYACICRDFVRIGTKYSREATYSREAIAEIALHLLSKIIQVIRCKDIISPPGGDDD